MRILAFVAFTLLATVSPSTARAEPTEKRVALVIGNAAYPSATLPTTANDAGLIAQALQAAGFDVVGARDLDQDTLRRTFRDFLDKVTASGPDTVAFVSISGYGVQLEGDNYIVPINAKLTRDTDVPLEALRLSDYTRPLAAMKIKAGIVVLDAARANSFAQAGQPLANGLALIEPEPHMLMGFNAAPGTVAPAENGPYGAYAQALAEMIRTGGLPLNDVFERTRLRVNEMTKGGEVPWHISKVDAPIMFFDRAADHRRRCRASKASPCGRGRSAISAHRTAMWPRSSETRCRAISISSPPIRMIRWRNASAPSSRRAVKR